MFSKVSRNTVLVKTVVTLFGSHVELFWLPQLFIGKDCSGGST